MLPAGHSPHDEKRLGPYHDGVGQRGIRRCVGQILLTGEEPHERSALLRDVVADCPAQHRIAGFEGVENRALRRRTLDVQLHLAVDACQCPHWGYLFRGAFKLTYTDGHEEIVRSGQAYYAPPGHKIECLEDAETVEFSPTAEFQATMAVASKNLAAQSG